MSQEVKEEAAPRREQVGSEPRPLPKDPANDTGTLCSVSSPLAADRSSGGRGCPAGTPAALWFTNAANFHNLLACNPLSLHSVGEALWDQTDFKSKRTSLYTRAEILLVFCKKRERPRVSEGHMCVHFLKNESAIRGKDRVGSPVPPAGPEFPQTPEREAQARA